MWVDGSGAHGMEHRAGRVLAGLAALGLLSGCSSLLTEGTSAAAGTGGAAIASSITSNGAVAAGIGLGVQAIARAGLQYAERKVHQAEQTQIAATAGPLPVGGVASWAVSHPVPIEADEKGQVAVSRVVGAPPLNCKEIVFSVDTVENKQPRSAFYTAIICNDGARWRWATAEPATERWGALQ